MPRKIIHIDMDCFYAAIEIRDMPSLKGKPIAVGGASDRRGVISTCNYEARKYGVRSAMATAYAFRLCPHLILLPVNIAKYKVVSSQIRQIFYEYTDKVEPLSLDEAFLDVTHCSQHQGSATRIAQAIREKIIQQHQLTASAGIAPNKFLAKIASDWNKPNGQFVITPETMTRFITALPIEKIHGVGKITAKKCHALGIYTCKDLQALSLKQLNEIFGIRGERFFNYCRGIDNRTVENYRTRKSVSVEETFPTDLLCLSDCLSMAPILANKLIQRLKSLSEYPIKNQFVKIKFNDFTLITAERASTQLNIELFQQLFEMIYQRYQLPVRLLGMGVNFREKFPEADTQQLVLNF